MTKKKREIKQSNGKTVSDGIKDRAEFFVSRMHESIKTYKKNVKEFGHNFKKHPIKELNKHADILFFVGYFLIVANQVLWTVTSLQPILPYFDVIGVVSMALFILINIKSYRVRDFVIIAILAIIFGIVAWQSHDKTLLKLLGVIAAFRCIDFKRFIKNDFRMRLFLFLTVIFLSFFGLTKTSNVMRDGNLRQSLGFQHPNMFGFYSIILSLESVYLFRRKIFPIIFVGTLIVVNYFLVDSRTAVVTMLLLFAYLLIPNRWSRVVIRNFPIKQVMVCAFLIFLAFSVFMTFNWDGRNNNWIFKLDKALNNRFSFTRIVENEYPANSLFGHYFEKRVGYKAAASMSTVLTVDNGYMYSLMFLGVIVTAILAFAYTSTFIKLFKTNNYTLAVILFLICLHLVSEGKITDIGMNPFLILLGLAIFGNWNNYERGDAFKLMRHSKRDRNRALLISQVNTTDYGKILQIFCMKRALEDFYVVSANNDNRALMRVDVLNYNFQKESILRTRKSDRKKGWLKLWFMKIALWPALSLRNGNLNRFRRKKLNLYPIDPIRMRDDLKYVDRFGMYVVGSDQMWKLDNLNEVNTLEWTKTPALKIAYAPQVRGGSLSARDLKKCHNLEDFAELSVEQYNYAITQISSVINKKIYEVANPIVLYGKDKLLTHCRVPKKANYCLCYLSGESARHRQYALKYTKYNNLKLKVVMGVDDEHLLLDKNLMSRGVWNLNPTKLINKVYNAKLVITDSFDVLVLCILLHKNFIALCREKDNNVENYKMLTFLEKVGLRSRFNKAPVNLKDASITKSKWKKIDKKIKKMRMESFTFLDNVLKYSNTKQK